MNTRSLCLPLHKAPIGGTLLSFLYQTRTIQTPARRLSRVQRSFHTSHRRQRDAIPFEDGIDVQQPDHTNRFFSKRTPQYTPHDPFAEDDSPRPPRAITITATEKAVFDRIFQEISADASKKAAKAEDPLDDEFEDDVPAKGDAYGDLNAIFDDALRKLRLDSQKMVGFHDEEARLGALPKNYSTAIKQSEYRGVIKRLDMSIVQEGEDYEAIQQSVLDHRHKVLGMLYNAGSDMDIWRVLDTEVFTLIKKYDSLKKEAEVSEKSKKHKGKRVRLAKTDQGAAAAGEKPQSLRAAKKTTKEAEVEAILSSSYGDYCLAAMRRLRHKYPTSPYCMNLLPKIKRLGPISHVLAASVELYNEMLFLRWKEYSDLHGMADLIIEMGNQGLESNEVTLRILKMVRNAKLFAVAEDRPMRKWWTLYPVQEGYRRLKTLARNMQREIMQVRVNRSVEEMESRNGTNLDIPLNALEDREGEAVTESERRMERSTADGATILKGGLGDSPSQRAEA
ncbi:MAG: hypothetical protein LQ338_003868 [Usnochroma carphineum]|nr:MAG: hypothetical protein LQ338_003868 [Usnochroma carphineum]